MKRRTDCAGCCVKCWLPNLGRPAFANRKHGSGCTYLATIWPQTLGRAEHLCGQLGSMTKPEVQHNSMLAWGSHPGV